jgi:hypothetical protein
MLSSVWDASCTCNADGSISSSTPHLELLLGGGENLVGSCLHTFAANEDDACRLQDFCRNTALSAVRQALTLQCTIRPEGLDSNKLLDACESRTCEATLYGIRLPPGAMFGSSCLDQDREHLFIGVKAAWPDSNIVQVASGTSNPAARPVTFAHDARLDTVHDTTLWDTSSEMNEAQFHREFDAASMSSLAYTVGRSTVDARRVYATVSVATQIEPELLNLQGASVSCQTESGFTHPPRLPGDLSSLRAYRGRQRGRPSQSPRSSSSTPRSSSSSPRNHSSSGSSGEVRVSQESMIVVNQMWSSC